MSQPPKYRTTIGSLTEEFKVFDTDGDGAITLGNKKQFSPKKTKKKKLTATRFFPIIWIFFT